MASEKVTAILEEIKALTVLDLSELVHAIEDEFGVTAAAPVAVAQVAAPADGGAAAAEKTEFDVELTEVGPNKVKVIKVVREVTGRGRQDRAEVICSSFFPEGFLRCAVTIQKCPK